jgi:hypothetical protein
VPQVPFEVLKHFLQLGAQLGLVGFPGKERPKVDPYKVAFDNLSRYPELLVEFKRRILLFRRLVREEAAQQGIQS